MPRAARTVTVISYAPAFVLRSLRWFQVQSGILQLHSYRSADFPHTKIEPLEREIVVTWWRIHDRVLVWWVGSPQPRSQGLFPGLGAGREKEKTLGTRLWIACLAFDLSSRMQFKILYREEFERCKIYRMEKISLELDTSEEFYSSCAVNCRPKIFAITWSLVFETVAKTNFACNGLKKSISVDVWDQ